MKKIRANHEIPKYKMGVPIILSAYMVLSLFANNMEHKTTWLMLAAIGTVMWYIGERIFPDHKYIEEKRPMNKGVLGLLGIFLGMTIVSEIMAKDYSTATLQGNSDSLLGIIGYLILFYMAYTCFYLEKNQRILRVGVAITASLVVVMSVLEFLDIPIACLWAGNIEVLQARNRVLLTFGNSNYYGMFCCMLIPFIFESWLRCGKRLHKVLLILLNGGLICCVLMSKSTAAVYLMIAVLVANFLYEYKRLFAKWRWLLGFFVTVLLVGIIVNGLSNGKLYTLMQVGLSNEDAFVEEQQELYEVKGIRLDGKQLIIESTDSSFIVEYDEALTFYNENNQILDVRNEGNRITFTESPYDALTVDVSVDKEKGRFLIEIDAGYKDTVDFYIVDGSFKGVGADGTAIDDISGNSENQAWNFLFTGRGYIWANTLPILKEVVLVGKGCGNFVHNFKQYDYVGLLESQGTHHLIIDRPHNMFLQYCVDVGILGTIAMFAMFAVILFGWIRKQFINADEENDLSVAAFISVVVFLIFSMLNDSVVVLTPYIWMFLGVIMSYKIDAGKHNII